MNGGLGLSSGNFVKKNIELFIWSRTLIKFELRKQLEIDFSMSEFECYSFNQVFIDTRVGNWLKVADWKEFVQPNQNVG